MTEEQQQQQQQQHGRPLHDDSLEDGSISGVLVGNHDHDDNGVPVLRPDASSVLRLPTTSPVLERSTNVVSDETGRRSLTRNHSADEVQEEEFNGTDNDNDDNDFILDQIQEARRREQRQGVSPQINRRSMRIAIALLIFVFVATIIPVIVTTTLSNQIEDGSNNNRADDSSSSSTNVSPPFRYDQKTNIDDSSSIQVEILTSLGPLQQIDVEVGHTCVLRSNRTKLNDDVRNMTSLNTGLSCWGAQVHVPANLMDATMIEMGNPMENGDDEEAQIILPMPRHATTIEQVAVGNGFTCALLRTRTTTTTTTKSSSTIANPEDTTTLQCWGDDIVTDYIIQNPPEDVIDAVEANQVRSLIAQGGLLCVLYNYDSLNTRTNITTTVSDLKSGGKCWGFQGQRIELNIPIETSFHIGDDNDNDNGTISSQIKYIAFPRTEEILQRLCTIIRPMDQNKKDSLQCWSYSLEDFDLTKIELVDVKAGSENEDSSSSPPFERVTEASFYNITSLAVMNNFVCITQQEHLFMVNGEENSDPSISSSLKCFAFAGHFFSSTRMSMFPTGNNYYQPWMALPSTDLQMVVGGARNTMCVLTLSDGRPVCINDINAQFSSTSIEFDLPIGPLKDLFIGTYHMCGIQREDSIGVCWGDTDIAGFLAPLDPLPTIFGRQVAAGEHQSCVSNLFTSSIECWGEYRYRLIVEAADISVGNSVTCVIDVLDSQPKCVVFGQGTFEISSLAKRVIVSHHDDMLCTISQEGSVQCYRAICQPSRLRNRLQCFAGVSSQENAVMDRLRGIQVKDLALSERHYCAIDNLNKLYCGTFDGSLNENKSSLLEVPEDLGLVISVTLGASFTCVVEDTFEVRCWGDTLQYGTAFVVDAPKGRHYRMVAATDNEVCAITQDNFVHCWGRPYSNALYVPSTKVFSVDNLVAGSDHFCAQLTNQEIVCWGSNNFGELSPYYFQ